MAVKLQQASADTASPVSVAAGTESDSNRPTLPSEPSSGPFSLIVFWRTSEELSAESS